MTKEEYSLFWVCVSIIFSGYALIILYLLYQIFKLMSKEIYKRVLAMKDDSGHWYIIPSDLKDTWHNLEEKAFQEDDYEAQEEFIKVFGQYMTGGSLNNVELYIKE